LETSLIRVLVVEDSETFRNFICSTLRERPELQIVGEDTDGLQALQRADELQPDLILLDIGLPSLNGIEVARQVRKLSPKSKVLFVSQEFSADVVWEALGTGAHGFVVKIDAGSELLKGVSAVLRGDQFVSRSFAGHDFGGASDAVASLEFRTQSAFEPLQLNMKRARRHDVGFYPDDASLLVNLTLFIGTALKAGHGAIVVATESHRNSLPARLQRHGVDIAAAIKQGRYISVDAADALSTFMINRMPDQVRFLKLFGNLIVTAAEAAKGEQARTAVFGEGVQLLWAQGHAEAAIRVERLTNQIAKTYDVDILCGYCLSAVQGEMDSHVFQRICAEHLAVYSR
jgi:DNA-binding NarL/FixJ family response regulator